MHNLDRPKYKNFVNRPVFLGRHIFRACQLYPIHHREREATRGDRESKITYLSSFKVE